MKSIPALARIAITTALLVCLSVSVPTARAASTNARNKEPFKRASYQRSNTGSEDTYPFEFHSGFWINLHHFLYEQALLRRRGDKPDPARSSTANPNGTLSPEQQQLWNAAVDYYWQPYLEGAVNFDKAVSNLVNAL